MVSPSVRSRRRTKMIAVYCCVWGQGRLSMASNWPRARNQNNCCVSPLRLPQPSWLLCPPVNPRPLNYLLNRFECARGGLFHPSPFPSTSCAEDQLKPTIPHLRAAAEAVSSPPQQNWRPRGQQRQGEASAMLLDGSCGHHPMIRRPSDMVSVVDRWVDGFFVVSCAWKSTVLGYVLSQKRGCSRSSLFLTAH